MRSPESIAEFLGAVRQSGLLESARLDCFEKSLTDIRLDSLKSLTNRMIDEGLLTHLQANLLRKGKTKNFLICGKYKLLEHIGAGGMGQVFLCEHIKMGRRVAIKVLPKEKAADPIYLRRFYREAQAVAALDHPNIVRAHDMDHDGPVHLLVMEYVDGSNLHEIVRQHGPLTIDRATDYIVQAAYGLHHAHEAGLVHRDVKPSNLLLDRLGQVRILDLGLARFYYDGDPLTQQIPNRSVIGTADYLAPEQAELSHAADARSDLYGLGATFYFLLAGHAPFKDGNIVEKIHMHRSGPLTPIRALRPDVPDEMSRIIDRSLAKDRSQRFQSGLELIDALAPFLPDTVLPPDESEMPHLCPAARSTEPPSGRFRIPERGIIKPRPAPTPVATAQPVRSKFPWRTIGLVTGLIASGLLGGTLFGKLLATLLMRH